MDPLSIVASVISIIQAVNKTLSICLSLRATLKESPNGLTCIIEEIRSLRNIFEALQLALDDTLNLRNSAGDSTAYESIWDSIRDIMIQCQVLLEDLNQQLGGTPTPAMSRPKTTTSRLVATLRWQLKEPQVRHFLEQIERCKSLLNLGLSAHQSTLLLDIRTTTISFQARMEASHSRLENKVDTISSCKSDKDEILRWLSPLTCSASHLDTTEQHQAGTSSWVITSDNFEKWHHGDARFLWLNGAPGTGKTQIFAHIIEYLLTDTANRPDQPVVAYSYCDFRKLESLEPSNILGSIVIQCCSGIRSVPTAIQDAFAASKSSGRDAAPPLSLLKETILEILKDRKLFILIDALDESQQATKVGDLLHGICNGDTNLYVKILVTGRNTESLEQAFANDLQIRLSDHKEEVHKDIDMYISSRIQSDRRLQWLHPDVKKHISETLNQESNSMFRWVQCQLDAISPLRSVKAIRQGLAKLPSGLEETYSRILSSIPQHTGPTIRSTLEWLCFSIMPLSPSELHEALAIEHGEAHVDDEARLCSPMDILTLGNSLFYFSSTGHIHLAHLSVRDYLLSPESRKDGRMDKFKFTLEESHRELTLKCLTYLLLEDLHDGPTATAEEYLRRLQQFPFLKYAASAWPYHANSVLSPSSGSARSGAKADDAEMLELIMEFFSPQRRGNFMAWVQVLNANYNFKWDIYPRYATPLYYAASFGLDCIVEKLIASKNFSSADLNAPGSRYGGTPLHAASYRHQASTVRILLKAGASAAKADFNGVTPLHSAAANGDLVVIRMLLNDLSPEEGANIKDGVGETPHDWAVGAGQGEAAEMLRLRTTISATMGKTPETTTKTGPGPQQQRQPERSGGQVNRAGTEDERSVSPPLGPISVNQPMAYFPDFYSKRSGLDSSIVVGVKIGKREA